MCMNVSVVGVEQLMFNDALELLKEQPEQKCGYWKKDSQFSSVFCSKCGFPAIEQYICDSIPPKQYLSKYCPWCGAKMDEEVKQDDYRRIEKV